MNQNYPQKKNPRSEVEFSIQVIKGAFRMFGDFLTWTAVAYVIFCSVMNFPLFDELFVKPTERLLIR